MAAVDSHPPENRTASRLEEAQVEVSDPLHADIQSWVLGPAVFEPPPPNPFITKDPSPDAFVVEDMLVLKTSRTRAYRISRAAKGSNAVHVVMRGPLSHSADMRLRMCMELIQASVDLQLMDQAAAIRNAGLSWTIRSLPSGIHVEVEGYGANAPLVFPKVIAFLENPPSHLSRCKAHVRKKLLSNSSPPLIARHLLNAAVREGEFPYFARFEALPSKS